MNFQAFTFDDVCVCPTCQIGLHSHECWELSWVLCGAGSRTIGDLTQPMGPGETVLIPPCIPHVWNFDPARTDPDGHIANISVFFGPQLIRSLRGAMPELAAALDKIESLRCAVIFTGETYDAITAILLDMRGLSPGRRVPKMIELLLVIADASDCRPAGNNNVMSRMAQRLERVRVYCACNYSRPITLEEVSRHAGMNKSAFCTFMRRYAGMTFSQYVNHVRLERARERLQTADCNIAEVALGCGFQSVTYFNRLFRAKYGCTPKAMKNKRL